ncbi:hypothetical protein NT6N_21380 [Oceaniferula spumae]|uniref:Ice-binding protein C-terminal domain-containing protein n=1 Tax=Oceaniferula spumae TaxID=2979115 RepID=A0AAT9FMB6_9BACT
MNKKTLLAMSGMAVLSLTAHAAVSVTENFDSYSAGNLNGQGGWTGPNGVQVSSTDPGFGMSGNVATYGGVDNIMSRPMGATFDDTNILVMEYDVRINGDVTYNYVQLNAASGLVAAFGVERENMTLRGADGGTQNFDHNLLGGNNHYHMVLSIDPTAFGGAGSATATYALYTAESTLGVATTAFSGVQLNLDDAGLALSDVNGMVLRQHNAGAAAFTDNIQFNQVPEPSSAVLVGLGGLALMLRRRK